MNMCAFHIHSVDGRCRQIASRCIYLTIFLPWFVLKYLLRYTNGEAPDRQSECFVRARDCCVDTLSDLNVPCRTGLLSPTPKATLSSSVLFSALSAPQRAQALINGVEGGCA